MKDAALDKLIIDDQKAGIFRVNRRAFTENEYLEREQARIFGQCWIYAGHESEIPRPGDFRSRRVAGRPLILVRGDDGVVRVLFNTCTHRGSLVCRQPRGNARSFQCPYHAWTYNCRGDLIGVPGEGSYSDAFDRTEFALGHPARVDTYRGFIFVNFDRGAPGLSEYLADAKEYLDLVCDQSETTMKISEGTQAYSIRANWKLLVENSIDGYHGLPTHQRYFTFLADTGADLRGGLDSPIRKRSISEMDMRSSNICRLLAGRSRAGCQASASWLGRVSTRSSAGWRNDSALTVPSVLRKPGATC